ncbi:MAG TPA: helix-turn-helix domain-containing protein [Hyphomicrobiaceae bacterium]|jgi:excisionase family DNA binding protein
MDLETTRRRSRQVPERLAHSVEEAAALTGVSRDRLYAAMNERALRARRFGRRTLILREDLMAWLRGLEDVELGHGEDR